MKRVVLFAVLFAVAAACAVPPALAQWPEGDGQGIPAYAVARLKVLDGSVWVRAEADGEWEEFETNSPVPPGSRISVPASSEGELQFHGGQFVLLTSGTDLEVRELREERSAFRIRAGEVRFDLTQDDFAPVTVRVPGGARVQVPRPGKYWVVVDNDRQARLVVRSGEAAVVKDEGKFSVRGGEQAVIREVVTVSRYGQAEEPTAVPPLEESADVQVPPSVNQELQDYGEWVTAPEYGYVWRPYVATGWTPYVYGRWVWVSPYGWTWVSNEPWGWYPYRCGYWVTVPTFGWVWYPYNAFVPVGIGVGYGTPWRPYYGYGGYRYYYRNAYYYPANVRFVPEGRQVRWVPLRPGERYRPADVRRGDPSLSRWNRPLESGRVFVRTGTDRKQTRDYTVVRTERQADLRRTLPQRTRADARPVRPEKMQDVRAPQPNRGTGQRPSERPDKAPPPSDGKGKSRGGGTYILPDPAPGRDRFDRDAKPPRGTQGAPATTVKPTGEPGGTTPREGAPAVPPPRGLERAEPSPAVVPPKVREYIERPPAPPPPMVRERAEPAPREEGPSVVPDVPEGVRGGGAERVPSGRSPDGGSGGGRGSGSGGGSGGGGRSR